MCPVTHRAKPYQLALFIKKSLDDVIGTPQSVHEGTLQYQYWNIHFSLVYMLYLQKLKVLLTNLYVFFIIYKIKLPLCVSFNCNSQGNYLHMSSHTFKTL